MLTTNQIKSFVEANPKLVDGQFSFKAISNRYLLGGGDD